MRVVIIFLLFITFALGQNNSEVRIRNDYSALNQNLSGAWIYNNEVNNVQGSFYLFKDWSIQGILITNNDQNLSLTGLNYDTKTNSFVAKVSEDSVYVFNNENIKEVIINRKKFKRYLNTGMKTYFEVVAVSNDIEILKKYEKKLKKGILNPFTQQTSPDNYVDVITYYFYNHGKIKELKLAKKPFINMFGEKSEAIKKYISKNNVSIKDERNFQTILNYYNTL
ncbi:hypothetical protein V8G56_05115 [Gaetbulibacter aquiaggeris]|uniref:DUF4369 domain-containing protein n=1 Tax=Gaetbulibacter aquiaggeris TaxID=1735373 RepID=A0ABW7MN83_9FLAO